MRKPGWRERNGCFNVALTLTMMVFGRRYSNFYSQVTLVREAKVLARSALSWYVNWVPDQALSSLALTSFEHGCALSPEEPR